MLPKPTLANAELAVMELLWRRDRWTAREILEELYPDTDRPQHGTVQRLLQRLEEKTFVERDRSLPVHHFSACIGREAYGGSQLESLAARLTGGSVAPLITQLMDEKKLSRTEIARLRQILDQADAGDGP